MDEAEVLLTELLKLLPANGALLHLCSTLKKATADKNHLEELKLQLQSPKQNVKHRTGVLFSLGKEAEDLSLWQDSSRYLSEGAALKRSTLNYNQQSELDSFQAVAKKYDMEMCLKELCIKWYS